MKTSEKLRALNQKEVYETDDVRDVWGWFNGGIALAIPEVEALERRLEWYEARERQDSEALMMDYGRALTKGEQAE